MRQVLQNLRSGELRVEDVPAPALKPGGILVRNRYSLISTGTERAKRQMAQKGYLGMARERPEQVKQVLDTLCREGPLNTYRKVMNRLDVPAPLGYSSAGEVIAVAPGIMDFQIGDCVACAGGGYAVHAEVVFVPKNLAVKLPENVDFRHAAFTTLGAIAMQGIRQAELQLGETVAIIGLGLVGQLTAQIAKAAGCHVIGIDLDSDKVELAKACGADLALVRGGDTAKQVLAFTDHDGADKVILTAATESNDPIELAGAIARDRAIVVIVGAVKADLPRLTYYEKELDLRFSRSYGPGRYDPQYEEKGIDYPIGYVRWTEQRNMAAFVELLSEGKLNVDKLITHRFPIERAPEAYELLLGKREDFYLGILIEYPAAKQGQGKIGSVRSTEKVWVQERSQQQSALETVQLGIIGAGNFAQAHLLPHLKTNPSVVLKGVATATSARARKVAEKFGFAYCTGDYHEILNDPEIDAVIIATRHNLHAPLVIEALEAGKAVFVEKPLALNEAELKEIVEAYNSANPMNSTNPTNSKLMVGFNRRFAPLVEQVQDLWGPKRGPWVLHYRVNAGALPQGHWLHDPDEGGGRLIGEVCHFIDLLQFLVGAMPVQVHAEKIANAGDVPDEDNVALTLKFADGSLGTINYFAVGDTRFPKERLEFFGDGKAAVIEDFRWGLFSAHGRRKKLRVWRQGKGHQREMKLFAKSLLSGRPFPMPFEQLVLTTLATFKAVESLRTGKTVEVSFTSAENSGR